MRNMVVSYTFEGFAPLSYNKFTQDKKPKEGTVAYEERVWKEKCHYHDGFVVNAPMSTLKGLRKAAKDRQDPIPGKKGKTYKDVFAAGIVPGEGQEYILVPDGKKWKRLTADDLEQTCIMAEIGGNKRSPKIFPIINPPWRISGQLIVVAPEVIEASHLIPAYFEDMGFFGGLGRWRPSSPGAGQNGRFNLISCEMKIKE